MNSVVKKGILMWFLANCLYLYAMVHGAFLWSWGGYKNVFVGFIIVALGSLIGLLLYLKYYTRKNKK